jgi:hypothetical protein
MLKGIGSQVVRYSNLYLTVVDVCWFGLSFSHLISRANTHGSTVHHILPHLLQSMRIPGVEPVGGIDQNALKSSLAGLAKYKRT